MRKQVEAWMAVHAVLLLAFSLILLYLGNLEMIAVVAALSFACLYVLAVKEKGSFSLLKQPANLTTSFRLILVLLVVVFYTKFPEAIIFLLCLIVLLTDWLDGWLARRNSSVTVFGEYLDMETDAFFVLVMSFILYQKGVAGWWILPVGLLRYAYFLAILPLKAPDQREERVFVARLIAVILMSSLVGGFILPGWLVHPLILVASILVFISFGRSFWVVLKFNLKG